MVIELLPSMHKALGSIISTAVKKKEVKRHRKNTQTAHCAGGDTRTAVNGY